MIIFYLYKTLPCQGLESHINLAYPVPDILRIFQSSPIIKSILLDSDELFRRLIHTNNRKLLIVRPLINSQDLSLRRSDPYGRIGEPTQNQHFAWEELPNL